jgi:3-hydroxyacyl-[acyl-carrier-protein] dehydratase
VADLDLRVQALGAEPPFALSARLVVPADHALLAGHFPGAPLVPGVLLLDAVRRSWELARGVTATLIAIDDARWSAPVAPGAELVLAADAAATADGLVSLTGEWRAPAGRVAAFALRVAESPRGAG